MYTREGLKEEEEEKKHLFNSDEGIYTQSVWGEKNILLSFFLSNRGAIPFSNTSAGRHGSGQEYMTRKGKKFKRI